MNGCIGDTNRLPFHLSLPMNVIGATSGTGHTVLYSGSPDLWAPSLAQDIRDTDDDRPPVLYQMFSLTDSCAHCNPPRVCLSASTSLCFAVLA